MNFHTCLQNGTVNGLNLALEPLKLNNGPGGLLVAVTHPLCVYGGGYEAACNYSKSNLIIAMNSESMRLLTDVLFQKAGINLAIAHGIPTNEIVGDGAALFKDGYTLNVTKMIYEN